MIQVLHIFRKDTRCFRIELGVIGALTAVFAWAHISAIEAQAADISRPVILSFLSSFFLVIGWWFLVTRAIHAEALTGHRQFWVTRPYLWKQLLAAKVLFVLAFVNAPLLVAQMAILGAAGYSPMGGFPRLLWMQLALTLVLLVPAFALGAVTRTLAQVVLAPLCGVLGLYFLLSRGGMVSVGFLSTEWLQSTILVLVVCAGSVFVVLRQYSARRVRIAVLAGLGTLVLGAWLWLNIPPSLYYKAQMWLYGKPGTEAVSVAIGEPSASVPPEGRGFVNADFPLTFSNIPANLIAVPEMVQVRPDAPNASPMWAGYEDPVPPPTGSVAQYPHHVFASSEEYRKLAGKTANMQVSIYFSLQNAAFLPLPPDRETRIPWGGRCTVSTDREAYVVFCTSPFRSAYDFVRSQREAGPIPAGSTLPGGTMELFSRRQSPWPAELALSPVFTDGFQCVIGSTLFLLRETPRAWAHRDFHLPMHFPQPRELR